MDKDVDDGYLRSQIAAKVVLDMTRSCAMNDLLERKGIITREEAQKNKEYIVSQQSKAVDILYQRYIFGKVTNKVLNSSNVGKSKKLVRVMPVKK